MCLRISLFAVLAGTTVGCATELIAPDPGPSVDEAALLEAAATYRTSGTLAEASADAYPSAVGTTDINVWISSFSAAAYAAVTPDSTGSGVRLPEGALIVREVLNAAGRLEKLTLMAKGPKGYNGVVGDYWFAVTDPSGTPLVANGVEQVGKLAACFGCHQERASDDFLFGIPTTARDGSGSATATTDEDGRRPSRL
jgi:hypothetical protein